MSGFPAARHIPIGKIAGRIRLTEPWRYKAPFLISVVYFFLYSAGIRFSDAVLAVACALCTIAGIASIGYLANDLCDRDSDRAAGKPNVTFLLGRSQVLILFVIAGAAAQLPWMIFVPIDPIWVSLLAAEYVLFAAYVARPIRLKERGFLGPIADALYAHANPALLAGYIMNRLTGARYPHPIGLLSALFAWQFFLGLRNILEHQISDAASDRLGGTSTYVTQSGEAAAVRLLRTFVVPLEFAGFAAYLTIVSRTLPAVAVAFLLHLIVTALIIRCYSSRFTAGSLHERLALFIDDFTLGWMPLITVASLASVDWRNSGLLLVHVLVFQTRLSPLFASLQCAARDAFIHIRSLPKRPSPARLPSTTNAIAPPRSGHDTSDALDREAGSRGAF